MHCADRCLNSSLFVDCFSGSQLFPLDDWNHVVHGSSRFGESGLTLIDPEHWLSVPHWVLGSLAQGA